MGDPDGRCQLVADSSVSSEDLPGAENKERSQLPQSKLGTSPLPASKPNGCKAHQKTAVKATNLFKYCSPLLVAANAIFLITMTIMVKAFPTFRRGFYCEDISIRYPHLPETISTKALLGATLFFSILVFILGEYIVSSNYKSTAKAKENDLHGQKKLPSWLKLLAPNAWYMKVPKLFLVFAWGSGLGHVMCYVIKCSLGFLRPHFLTACNPNVTCEAGDREYHVDYVCQSMTAEEELRARQAFPSGHATFAGFAAIFLIAYGQSRFDPKYMWSNLFIFRPMFQAAIFMISGWISATRVSDYVHHLSDVVAGYLLGGVIGVVLSFQVLRWLGDLYENPEILHHRKGLNDRSEMVVLRAKTGDHDKKPKNTNHTDFEDPNRDVEKGD